ncbi:unnamed protein product [Lactuca saligna]|uniref:Uncharacterized protein n=1 Tax=Lactuca saligna TaxID=75948 RepID=A0AA35YL32_LACSI|nr:unnamed protein product [Lactuca saligna]
MAISTDDNRPMRHGLVGAKALSLPTNMHSGSSVYEPTSSTDCSSKRGDHENLSKHEHLLGQHYRYCGDVILEFYSLIETIGATSCIVLGRKKMPRKHIKAAVVQLHVTRIKSGAETHLLNRNYTQFYV